MYSSYFKFNIGKMNKKKKNKQYNQKTRENLQLPEVLLNSKNRNHLSINPL